MELWSFSEPVVAVVIAVVMVTVFPVDSELLQALDLCDNDPVAVARCFVLKVWSAQNHQNIQTFCFYFEGTLWDVKRRNS